ncbi:peptidylprolyl isomerase [Nocardia sp. NBC_01503]|uniref:peptidylprolyl isomerase n=1 Tax=Nocardia sp. NBC_01503 TaxID=2975997 RepID=UPI002E7BD3ED|nr:peptidylprolyl isomerase [Nocardia sp. NBC_01503]WTL35080.1 peptidylprolyl isomerase [Nocardia sp. NBC_01503]
MLVAVIVIAAGAVVYLNRPAGESEAVPLTTTTVSAWATETMIMQLPNPVQKKPAMVSCAYRATPGLRQIAAQLPKTADIRANTGGRVPYQMNTGLGVIGLSLDTAASPCTVNSFISLATQHYYDATKCHRMTTSPGLKVLQCGDPSGTGMGGPGYQFENEYPTDVFASPEKAATEQVLYPRGTLAMANAGPDPLTGAGTNGSQFFLVYGDSTLPPTYTVFGTVDQAGLAVLDRVAAAGTVAGGEDGEPKLTVDIGSIAAK